MLGFYFRLARDCYIPSEHVNWQGRKMFIPKSDVLWICLPINNELRDKIYNYKGRCQPGHLPDFFVGGELLHIRPRGELTKVQKDCFRDTRRPSLIPPLPSGKGSIFFLRKKSPSQPFLDSSEFFWEVSTGNPWYLTSWDKFHTPPSLPWCCSLSSPLLSLFSYYNLKVRVCRLRSEWILLV